MSAFLKSIFRCDPLAICRRIGRWMPDMRMLAAWGTVALARLKDLAPYALMEILLPGGSVLALTLWFYRRRKRASAPAGYLAKQVRADSQC